MKSLLVAIVVLSLTTISCTKTEIAQPTQEEIQSRRHQGPTPVGTGAQVTGVSATAQGPNSIYISWNSVPNATSYWIYRDNTVIAIMTNTNFTDNYVNSGTSYTYAVAAVVNSVLGPKSTSVTVMTP